MSTFDVLKKIVKWYYKEQLENHNGVAWISAFTPVEILRAMNVACYYPENQAVQCAPTENIQQCFKKSGLPKTLCGYMRAFMGNMNLPKPDFLVTTNNQCSVINGWFRQIGKELNVPVFYINYSKTDVEEQHDSLLNSISDRLKITLDKFNEENYIDSCLWSETSYNYWRELRKLGMVGNLKINKLFDEMFPMVISKGTYLCAEYYKELYREKLDEEYDVKSPRIFWYGYPFWFLKDKLPKSVIEHCVMADYPYWWDLTLNGIKYEEYYRHTFLNWSIEGRVKYLKSMVREYSVDGVIIHKNRSCHRDYLSSETISKSLDSPNIIVEGDMMDSEAYSMEHIDRKCKAFIEELNVRT